MEKTRILIVEDERITAEDLRSILKSLGYAVAGTAGTSKQALELVEQTRPHLILMDIIIKGRVDGVETARRIGLKHDLPIVFITAHSDNATIARARNIAPFGYIVKPFEDQQVHSTIQIALHKHQLEKELRHSRQWLQTTLSSIGDAVIATDQRGTINFMNPVAEKLTGWTLDEARQESFATVFNIASEATGKRMPSPLDKILRTGTALQLANHTVLLTKDGRKIPIADAGTPIRDEHGVILGAVLVFRDETEKRAVHRALSEGARVWQQTFDSMTDVVCMLDAEGRVIKCNHALAAISKRRPDEVIGLPCHRVICGEKSREHDCIMLRAKKSHRRESSLRRIGDKWYQCHLDPVFDEHGKFVGGIHISSDITSLKLAEMSLRRNEEKYRELVELANSIIMRRTGDGKITFFNEYAQQFLGFTEAEITGRNMLGTIVPAQDSQGRDQARLMRDIGRHPEKYRSAEMENVKKNGERVWIAWSNRAVLDEKGRVREVLCVGHDLTAHKKIEDEVRKFKIVTDQASYGTILVDLQGTIMYINASLAELNGYRVDELLGENATLLYQPEAAAGMAKLLEHARQFVGHEMRYTTRDGRELTVLVSGTLITEHGGGAYIAATVIDISERVKLEKQQQITREQLVQAQKMEAVGLLAGGIAHDFNNSLTVVRGYVELTQLKMGEGNPLLHYLNSIQEAVQQALDLTGQLLIFSRKQKVLLAPLDINETMGSMRGMIARLIGEDVSLRFLHAPALPAVLADKSSLQQVFMNMAVNARDAMPHGGTLSITTDQREIGPAEIPARPQARPGHFVVVTVADSGTGMGAEVLEHIFEPFYSTKETGKGTGLGLPIAHTIIQQHQGWIEVESLPGAGTQFHIFLPACAEQPATRPGPAPVSFSFVKLRKRVLLVEDEQQVRESTRLSLEEFGCRVDVAVNAEEALRLLAEPGVVYDQVVCDVILPDLNGMGLWQRMEILRPGQRILFVSGYGGKKDLITELESHGLPFLAKPFSLVDLYKAIQ